MSNEPWSIRRRDWENISGRLVDGTWYRVSFSVASQDLVKSERGIYLITMKVPKATEGHLFNEIQNPIYIGLSINLRQRFKQHTSSRRSNALWRKLSEVRNFCSFNYCCFPDLSQEGLKNLEQQLIDCFGKQLNEINSVAQGAPIRGVYSIGGENA